MPTYTRKRSKFWLGVFEKEDIFGNRDINVYVNSITKGLLKKFSPQLIKYSPTGWKESSQKKYLFNLWFPYNRIDEFCLAELDRIKTWAEHANQHIWLSKNSYTENYFAGDEVDYCMAADWNMYFDNRKRTTIGEAEYQIKYNSPKGFLSEEDTMTYVKILTSAIDDCVDCLPFNLSKYIVTAIPAVREKQCKLAWELAKYTAHKIGAPFMEATLMKDKPQMKEKSIGDKIRIWREIFAKRDMIELSCIVEGKKILIIDDLYQSGASIWCFAEFLKKQCDAKKVIAITSVKALKDGDNQ